MKSLLLGLIILTATACTTTPIQKHSHGLTGGVKEPTYDVVNCWVQPPHDDLWYPCPDRANLEGYLSHGH